MKISRILLFSLMVSPILIFLFWPAFEEKRIALVLGNSDYTHSYPIGTATNNAKAVSRSLRRLGFDVIVGTNLSRSAIESSIQKFASQLNDADVALLYYSGYVYQESGRTYIAPIEAKPSKPYQLEFQTIEMRSLLIQMANSTRSNLVLFDACRAILSSTPESALSKCLPMTRIPIQKRVIISYPTKLPVALATMQRGKSKFTKSFLDNMDRVTENNKQALFYNAMLEEVSSDQSGILLTTSQTGPDLIGKPALVPEEKTSQTNLPAISSDDQTEKQFDYKSGSTKKRKITNRVTRESWKKRKLRQMLESID